MITRHTNHPGTWDISPSTPSEMIPHLVNYVDEQGGVFINTRDKRICVNRVMRFKKDIEEYAIEARVQLLLLKKASNIEEELLYKQDMRYSAHMAGVSFFLYKDSIGCKLNPATSSIISEYPILKEFWDKGYVSAKRNATGSLNKE